MSNENEHTNLKKNRNIRTRIELYYKFLTWTVSKSVSIFLTKEMYIKLKLINYNAMIKIGKHDLIDIIDIKNTRLSHTFYQQKFCKM